VATEKRERQRAARAQKLEAQEKQAKRKTLIRRGAIVAVVALIVVLTVWATQSNTSKTPATTTTTKAPVTTTTMATSTTSTPTSTTLPTSFAPPGNQAASDKVAVAAGCPASPSTRVNTLSWSKAPAMTIDTSKTYTAVVTTDLGPFTITLDPKAAPQTVNSFVFLANQGYYHCVIFHRVIPQFMDQTGDPQGTGTGGPGYTIPDENPPAAKNPSQQYALGAVAMANTGQAHSGGSQFFIVAGPQGEGLPNSYALFGQVTSGMNIVSEINADGSAQGVPPTVTHRMLAVTVTAS
jgi:cyclophilin family peptidyl-prolyl cis-trans isomerase